MAEPNEQSTSSDNPIGNYPNYEEEASTFEAFLNEHEILTSSTSPEVQDDPDALLEPGTDNLNLYRVKCYRSLLQRIKDRHYYTDGDDDDDDNSNGNSGRVFIVEVPLDELMAWDGVRGMELANRAIGNTHRYQALFSSVVDRILNGMQVSDGNGNTNNNGNGQRDTIDVLHQQRLQQQAQRQQAQQLQQQNDEDDENGNLAAENAMREQGVTDEFPPVLMRRYELRILPTGRAGIHHPFKLQHRKNQSLLDQLDRSSSHNSNDKNKTNNNTLNGVSLRHIRSQSMGKLVTIRGMIVRASDVKPCCIVATYTCDACGCEIYQVIQSKREFMPQRFCPSPICARNGTAGNKDTLHLQTRGSKFEKFQELKIQELPSQVPMGHVPRSMTIHCRGEMTRLATPGDVVTVDGIFLPQRVAESGYRAMKAGLMSTTYLEAQNLIVHKKSYDDSVMDSLSEEAKELLNEKIMDIATGEDPVGRLSSSIAPEIYGHEDIKRALLLQLVSGCTRTLPDGMRIRGDINICLMGDPGVAKSQMLKHVASIAPRGVYTTGKGSSGVGLTAAITKDLATGEMALEGGALVLADQGICAIDEFDKMDEADRTAIHEVMEQQTVSVAKAGIVATLNARAAVLAAANPLYGRYNRKKSLSENVNLPNSLLSRFDLMFLILDIADVDKDMALARHVTFVHQNEGLTAKNDANESNDLDDSYNEDDDDNNKSGQMDEDEQPSESKTVPPEIVREYISRARKFQPVVEADVAPFIVESYVGLRMQGTPGSGSISTRHRQNQAGDQTAMTARQLLSILRLGQALARLRFSDIVAKEDVNEAIRLTHMSKASLDEDYHGEKGEGKREDVTSRIFAILKDYATASRTKRIELKLCEAMALRKGFTEQQLKTCIEEYQALDVILLNTTGTHIDFLQ